MSTLINALENFQLVDQKKNYTWTDTTLEEFLNDLSPSDWEPLFHETRHITHGISKTLHAKASSGKVIYPPLPLVYNAFFQCPFHKLKVVIIGQDPYHAAGQAMGLSFSVPPGIRAPPSLRNIFRELKREGFTIHNFAHGDLTSWANQGVLLLNSALTVEKGKPGSHSDTWSRFTEQIVRFINRNAKHVVFLLWGYHASMYSGSISSSKHCVIRAGHPSPMNQTNPFMGCDCFRKCNLYLEKHGKEKVDWGQPSIDPTT